MSKWDHMPVGTRVRCVDPNDFTADYRRKLTNRVGTVRSHDSGGKPVIDFAKEGNRKPFTWVPSYPQWVEVVP